MSKFLHDNAKTIAIPRFFSENSRAKNGHNSFQNSLMVICLCCVGFPLDGERLSSQ